MTISLRDARPSANWKDVISVMRPDLNRVEERVARVAQVNFPAAASIVSDIISAGGKRLRPLVLLLAARGYRYAEHLDEVVTAAAGIQWWEPSPSRCRKWPAPKPSPAKWRASSASERVTMKSRSSLGRLSLGRMRAGDDSLWRRPEPFLVGHRGVRGEGQPPEGVVAGRLPQH